MATAIFLQVGVPVFVGVALVANKARRKYVENVKLAKELARRRKRFEFFANGA